MSFAGTRVLRLLAEVRALPAAEPVPSPCNCVCRVDPASGLCDGCLRTLDEIAGWTALDAAGKRAVWERLGERARQRPAEPA